MFSLIFGQMSLWVFLIVALAGIWITWVVRDRKDIQTPGVASLLACLLISLCYWVGMETTEGLKDFCYLNGHLQSAKYEQGYTREYTTTETYTDSKGKSHSRTVTKREHVPPQWRAYDSLGDSHSIEQADYAGYVKQFGNQVLTDNGHHDQVSYGDGKTYVSRWNGTEATIIPWSSETSVINWVRASKFTIMKKAAGSSPALPYPAMIQIQRGPKVPRVLVEGVTLPVGWKDAMEWNLDVLADKVGAAKQCNPLIYITNQGPAQAENIRNHWVGAKKNDVVVIIGVQSWPKADWVQVIAWSKDAAFPTLAQNALQEVSLDNGVGFIQTLQGTIMKDYTRKPMKDFEYLKNDIQTPTWVYVLALILSLSGVVAMFTVPDQEDRMYRRF